MHEGQVTVTADTVAALVAEQFPRWAGGPVERVGRSGTVNAIFRLGSGVAARFPLLPTVRDELEEEARAAATLVGATTWPTPEPLGIGEPGHGYPFPWSVQTWLAGETADTRDPATSEEFALDLAQLVSEVRAVDTAGRTFSGNGRGGDLRDHDDWVAACLDRSHGILDVDRARALWAELRDLPPSGPDVTAHGDLTPGNVLVTADLRLAGVLDTGGTAPADPALDLVGAWHLLDQPRRALFRRTLGSDDVAWQRGRAWALQQALGAAWYYATTNPAMAHMGRRTAARVLESAG